MKRKNDTNTPKARGPRRRMVVAGLAATIASAGFIAASAGAASATDGTPQPAPTDQTVEVFRATIKPLDSITIPSTACDTNYLLENKDFSPGRIVPRGVEIAGDSGWIGTTITHSAYRSHNPKGTEVWLHNGTDASKGASTATNWDPFTSHELVVNLHCTLDWGKANITLPYSDPLPFP
jgi:hypothetical protein